MADERLPHPFHVFFDGDEEKYYIFAPAGCVLVAGVAVEIADAQNGNVELDLDPDDLPDALYAHVTKDANATGGYSVTFDGNATDSGAEWSFMVTRFGAAENDGNQYDVAVSAVNLGGGSLEIANGVTGGATLSYVVSDDPDFSLHPYALRLTSYPLIIVDGKIQLDTTNPVKQFVETVPYSNYTSPVEPSA